MANISNPCAGCMYYGKSTDTCDYILIADQRRPCPPGLECTVRRTLKEVKKMGKPRWDTEFGRLLWLEGKSDAQIAKEMGVAPNTVLHQRRKWEKTTTRPEPAEAAQETGPAPELAPMLTQAATEEKKETPPPHPLQAWPHRKEFTTFWKRPPKPNAASRQSARQMQFFVFGIGTAQTICGGQELPLII